MFFSFAYSRNWTTVIESICSIYLYYIF
jgi:hypothetical protein